jgi:serine/threonine protein kinase
VVIFELISIIIKDPIPALPESDFSPLFRDFINKCLCKDGNVRPTPAALLKNHPIVAHCDQLRVDMVAWARSFLENNLNEKQMQRWSVTKAQKRQSWMNAMERRRSQARGGTESLRDGFSAISLSRIQGSPTTSRRSRE